MKIFIIKLIVFSMAVVILDLCWMLFTPIEKHVPLVWMMILFFCAIIAIFHYFSIRQSKGRPQGFIRFYMGSTALRFFIYIMIIVAYRFYDKPTLIPFAIGFMGHYFLFTIFEVPTLLKELEKH